MNRESMLDLSSPVKLQRKTFEDNFVFFTLLRPATAIVTAGDRVVRNTDVTLTIREFDVIAQVGVSGPNRPRDLLRASALVGNPQTLSSVLDRLDRRDLISRVPNESDSRSVEVSNTDQELEQLDVLFPLLSEKSLEPFNFTIPRRKSVNFPSFSNGSSSRIAGSDSW